MEQYGHNRLLRNAPRLSDAKQRELLVRLAAIRGQTRHAVEHERIKNILVSSNLLLVAKYVTNKWKNHSEFEDIVQVGTFGLMRALDTYDPEKFAFSTYAIWWIRSFTMRYITEKCHTIRLPQNVRFLLRRVDAAHGKLVKLTGRIPSAEEIVAELADKTTVHDVEKAWEARATIYPGDRVVFQEPHGSGARTFFDMIVAEEHEHDEDGRAPAVERLKHALSQLTSQEQNVIQQRFGLDCHEKLTLDAIGTQYGRSRERIRQIERDALQKLAFLMKGSARRGTLDAELDYVKPVIPCRPIREKKS